MPEFIPILTGGDAHNITAQVVVTDEAGITALMYAAMFKNKNAVMLLLQKKADKTKIDAKGKTAFEYAVFSGQEEIINLLK